MGPQEAEFHAAHKARRAAFFPAAVPVNIKPAIPVAVPPSDDEIVPDPARFVMPRAKIPDYVVRDWLFVASPDLEGDISIREIQCAVCLAFGVTLAEIRSHLRNVRTVDARHASIWLCRKLTALSTPQIARRHGNRDHTTILASISKIERKRKEDTTLALKLDLIRADLERSRDV